MTAFRTWALVGAMALSGTALAQAPAAAPVARPAPAPAAAEAVAQAAAPAPAAKPRVEGYLGKERIPNSIAILPPPPPKGSLLEKMDNDTYAATRKLAGSDRYVLATRDATQYIPAFDCAVGLQLENGPPEVLKLFARVGRDASAITNLAKDHFNHPRPFIAPNGPICTESDRAGLIKSYSYPSGHTTYSWAMGLILAELVPEHATEILARARSFGESRVVCGVHTVSDVEEGRTNGAALVAVLHSDAAFRADMDAAKTALAAAMTAPHAAPDAGQCKIEADAMAHTPWINPTGEK